jgi:hypothetical protein
MRRLVPVLALMALALTLSAPSVRAGNGWCMVDPVVKIDGKTADIRISGPDALDTSAVGPTQLVVTVPAGVSTDVLALDRGFHGYGYAVTFLVDATLVNTPTNLEVRVAVFVPALDATLPVVVDFLPRSSPLQSASASGTANAWVAMTTSR